MSAPGHPLNLELPFSAAAERNRGPILGVLRSLLPAQARVLEIASGTGQHAEHFAAAQPGWQWQPTEARAESLPALAARCAGLSNALPPRVLDVLAEPWDLSADTAFDAVFVANLLHISPWPATGALMRGAARVLRPGGVLAVYGPFVVDGVDTAASNLAFDADLRSRDPRWGLRALHEVEREARAAGLQPAGRHAMPANNLMVGFRAAG